MKLGPKEIKVVNEYFVRPVKNRLKEIFMKKGLPQLRTADEIKQPPVRKDVEDIQAINEFNKRNPRADGGMLVKPSDDGSRPGYAKQKYVKKGYFTGPRDYLSTYPDRKPEFVNF